MPSFPATSDRFTVFALLSDGLGDWPMALTIARPDTLEDIYRRSWTARFTNPLSERRLMIRLRDFTWPIAGRYAVILWADEQEMAQATVELYQREE